MAIPQCPADDDSAIHLPPAHLVRNTCAPDDRLSITFCTGGLRSYRAANLLLEYGFEAENRSGEPTGRRGGQPVPT